ncbi:MAG: lysophospholipase [Bacillota bacterium]|nr:lysophospholipase [Bacillota bacterium]
MRALEFSNKAKDGSNLFFRKWLPEGAIKAVICIVHGLGDHSGWFSNMSKYLTNNNFAVVTFDLRGHGKSEGKRGHIPSYEALMDDIDILINTAKESFYGLPVFLFGHSFGGNQVLNYVLRRHPKIAGVMASAPWLSLYSNPSAFKLYSTFLFDKIYPTLLVDNVVNEAALSHKPGLSEEYSKDPLVHSNISARLFTNAYKSGLWAVNHAYELDIPLLIFHGDEDKITSHKASIAFANNAPKELCTLKIWEGLYHSLHNEISNEEIFLDIVNWINAKVLDFATA